MKKRVLLLTSASHCVNHMFFESLGPLLPFLIMAFDLNHVQAGRLGLVYFFVYGLLNYPSGHWCDKYGRRIFIILFLLISSSATILMAFSSTYISLLLLCGLAGFGGGLYHPPGTALISDHFQKTERGSALGAHASGGALGILLAFIVVGGIASRWNWQIALICLSAIGLALAACFRLLIWDVGESSDDHVTQRKDFNENEKADFWALIKWLPYMLFLYGIIMFVWKGAYTWMPTYLKETYNLTPGKAITFSVILPTIGIFSNYLMGKFSDHYGRRVSLVIVFSFLVMGFFFLFVGNRTFLIPLLLVFGFFINSFSGIINAYIGDYLPPRLLGKAFGITFTFSICISAFAPYVMGFISDMISLSMSMLFLSLMSLIGALTSLKAPKPFSGQ